MSSVMSALETRIRDRIRFFVTRREVELPKWEKQVEVEESRLQGMVFNDNPTAWYRQRDAVKQMHKDIQNVKNRDEEYDYLMDIAKVAIGIDDIVQTCDHDFTAQVPTTMQNVIHVSKTFEHGTRYAEYMASVEQDAAFRQAPIKKRQWICPECGSEDVYDDPTRSETSCQACGITTPYLGNDRGNITYEQDCVLDHSKQFSYKKVSRFEEIISQFQATDDKDIPSYVVDRVRNELANSRIRDVSKIMPVKVKGILKKLDLTEYYACHVQITKLLGGDVPAPFSSLLKHNMRAMFSQTTDAFEEIKHRVDKKRVNMLSYPYVIYKLLEMLGESQYLKYLQLLKSSNKLYMQDKFWKEICTELGWEFIRTV